MIHDKSKNVCGGTGLVRGWFGELIMTGAISMPFRAVLSSILLASLIPTQVIADGVLDCVHFSDRFDQEASPPLNSLCISICPVSPCRLTNPQCGCKDGFGCYLEDGTRQCLTEGIEGEGEACSADSRCSPGLSCIGVGNDQGEVVKRCLRACDSDAVCTGGSGSLCTLPVFQQVGDPEPVAEFCSLSCDPVTSDGCTVGTSCQVFRQPDGEMQAFTHCRAPVGPGSSGSACNDFSDCQAGLGCFDAGAGPQCMQYCADDNDCPGSTTCAPFDPPAEIDGTSYGVCVNFFLSAESHDTPVRDDFAATPNPALAAASSSRSDTAPESPTPEFPADTCTTGSCAGPGPRRRIPVHPIRCTDGC